MGAITNLQTKLGEFSPNGPKEKRKNLKYPFEKTTLLEMRSDISEIRDDLNSAMTILHMDLSLRSNQKNEDIDQHVNQASMEFRTAENDRAARARRKDVLEWLSTLSPSMFMDRHNGSLGRRKQGTGLWIFEEELVKQWLGSNVPTLWCPGIPGCGKTVVMSIIVEYLENLRTNENIAVAYVYCVYDQQHQTASHLMASILAQFARQSAFSNAALEECWNAYRDKTTGPSLSEYVRHIKALRSNFSTAYLLVDALDELPDTERRTFVNHLSALTPDVQILVTSRNKPSVLGRFKDASCMQIQAREEDVRAALEARVEAEEFLRHAAPEDSDLRHAIIDTICQKARGMFILAELHITALSQEENMRDLRESLERLPDEITGTYAQTVARIDSQNPKQIERARKVLCWLSHTRRPLQVRELQQALAIKSSDKTLVHDSETDINTLLSDCMGLVIMDKQTDDRRTTNPGPSTGSSQHEAVDIVRFVHYTAQEFFEDSRHQMYPSGHQIIAQTCLSALLLSDVDVEACRQAVGGKDLDHESLKTLSHLRATLPIIRYASEHWGDHARLAFESDTRSSVKEYIQRFIRTRSNITFSTWITNGKRDERSSIYHHPDLSALHVVAEFGITCMLQDAFNVLYQADIDVRDSRGRTPLHLACQGGHLNTVQALLDRGANKNATTRKGDSPLGFAVRYGHSKIVEELLKVDVEIGARAILGDAVLGCDNTVVRMLVEKEGAKDLGHVLAQAAGYGEESTVRMVLDMMQPLIYYKEQLSKALITLTGTRSQASSAAYIPLMNLLLEKGADPNYEESNDFVNATTPLCWAAESLDAVSSLVERGALVSFRDQQGRTVLHSPYITPETCLFLIDKGADVNNCDTLGRTPLHDAVIGRPEVLRCFLERHADVDVRDKDGITPLGIAATNTTSTDGVIHLLEAGANSDLKDERGHSPLHKAIFSGNSATCELFMKYSKSSRDWTFVMQIAKFYHCIRNDKSKNDRIFCDHNIAVQLDSLEQSELEANTDLLDLVAPCELGLDQVIRRFLAAGADLQSQGLEALDRLLINRKSWFSRESSSVATLELLIDHGLPIDTRHAQGNTGTALCRVCELGSMQAVAMLLRKRADPHIGGRFGSPLMIVACGGLKTRPILKCLLDHHIDINRPYADTVISVKCGPDLRLPNHSFPVFMTALHMCAASIHSSGDDIRLLVSHGADLEAKNSIGETPLTLAVRCGRLVTTAALIAEGADTNASSLLTREDRIRGIYEVDFHKALSLVRDAHSQRAVVREDHSSGKMAQG
ncbi:ankyrin [Aureobasidium pullulans]|uniref:Ankyrin n=1 Tax=Aureobasidium pullulans TaxID=5580 RepID=A0A4S9U994_AURPU|nr:ankyrin [Aureobasidium pullulans]